MSDGAHSISRRRFLQLAALAGGTSILGACSPTAAPVVVPPPAQAGATAAPVAAQPTAVSAPKSGGTLTLGSTQPPPQLDPHIVTFAAERLYFPGLYNGLTEYNADMEPVPCLAESWKASDDLKTYTFNLRKGVKFHNGRELEAADVKWNFERCLDPKLGSQLRQNVQEVDTIDVVDKYTVKMNLSSPSVTLPMGCQELKIIAKESLDNINKGPVGTGPYMYQDFLPNESLTMKRFDGYWGGTPYLEKVVLTGNKDSTAAVTALQTGQWDVMWELGLKDATTFKDDPKISLLLPKISSANVFWELDVTSPPFDKKEARQALSYAVDRKTIVDAAYFGFGTPSITNNFVSESHWAFNPNLTRYDYNLDKAKQLFTQAGVNESTELIWWAVAGVFPEWITAGEILIQSLAKIGIKMSIQQNEIGAWVDKFYPSGKKFPGMVIPNGDTAALDPAFPLKFFASKRCECNYNDAKIDQALAAGRSTPDKEKRKAAYQEVQRIVNDQIPVIVPCSWSFVDGAAKYVRGVWAESGGQIHYESAWLDK